jgi:DNA ligase-associated metallophosphoesterase
VSRPRTGAAARLALQVEFEFGGAAWRALPQRALLWPARRWLVVADVHVGKAATFRARGVPVPQGTTLANLARLDAMIESLRPRRLVFLGDLLHAPQAHAATAMRHFAAWRQQHAALPMTLVEGNHDRRAGALPGLLDVETVAEPWRVDGVALCHHPRRIDGAPAIAGHLHPCVRLHGANDSLRLPCFWLRDGLLTLPAFGEFTGGAVIEREAGDRVLAVADDRLIEIPACGLRAA